MHIEHVAIWTRNLEDMRRFYEKYFQAVANDGYHNPVKNFRSYFLTFGTGARLELMQMEGIPGNANDPLAQYTGLIHLAISVGTKERVDELTETLRLDGYAILDGPRFTGDGYYEAVVLDPEQNRIEITV